MRILKVGVVVVNRNRRIEPYSQSNREQHLTPVIFMSVMHLQLANHTHSCLSWLQYKHIGLTVEGERQRERQRGKLQAKPISYVNQKQPHRFLFARNQVELQSNSSNLLSRRLCVYGNVMRAVDTQWFNTQRQCLTFLLLILPLFAVHNLDVC